MQATPGLYSQPDAFTQPAKGGRIAQIALWPATPDSRKENHQSKKSHKKNETK
jgi:hypothetical protein